MDIGLKYQAINEGKIDVMVIFTTDGQLSVSDVTVLEDDKNFYPSYLCGNVIRSGKFVEKALAVRAEMTEMVNDLQTKGYHEFANGMEHITIILRMVT